MTFNAGNRKDIRQLEKASKLAEQNRGETLRQIMSTLPGREYIWSRLEAAHVFHTSFHESPTRMAFAEGERNQGILLLNDLMQWTPDEFILAMREANARRSEHDSRDDRSGSGERTGGEDAGRSDSGPAGEAALDPGDADPDSGGPEAGRFVHPLQ